MKSIKISLVIGLLSYSSLVFAQTMPMDTTTNGMTAPTTDTSSMEDMTPEPVGPSISSVNVTNITDKSARVDIDSDEVVQGYVEYGTTEQYGMSTPLSSEFSTTPSFLLENLTAETLYHYRVIVMDSAGNAAITTDETFTTLATPKASEQNQINNTSTSTTTSSGTNTTNTGGTSSTNTSTTTTTQTPTNTATSTTSSGTNNSHIISTPTYPTGNTNNIINATSSANSTNNQANTGNASSNTSEQKFQSATPIFSQGGGGIPVAPSRPLLLRVIPLDGQVLFHWLKDKGGHNGEINTLIVKKEGTDIVRSRVDGVIIYDGPSTSFTDTNLENGKEYHYALYSYGSFGRFTAAARFKIIPKSNKNQISTLALSTKEETTPSLSFGRNLFYGRRGYDVVQLQKFLYQEGYYPEGSVTGYFGQLTRAAVIRFQKLNGISPAIGYVGTMTRENISR